MPKDAEGVKERGKTAAPLAENAGKETVRARKGTVRSFFLVEGIVTRTRTRTHTS